MIIDKHNVNLLQSEFSTVAARYFMPFFQNNNLVVKFVKPRKTKLGDYRYFPGNNYHVISLNQHMGYNLSVIVFLHELSHMEAQVKFRRKIAAHGLEWKNIYSGMVEEAILNNLFEETIVPEIKRLFAKKLSSGDLSIQLRRLFEPQEENSHTVLVQDIPENTVFQLTGGATFIKRQKLRKRFKCEELNSGRIFLVHPLAPAITIQK